MIKIRLKNKICKKIVKDHENILNELKIILNDEEDYKYNSNSKKIKKHFPGIIFTDFNEFKNYVNKKYPNKKVTFSLLNNDIKFQIKEILETAERRYNTTKIFDYKKINSMNISRKNPILTQINLKNELIKYEEKDIIIKYPEFYDKKNNRSYYEKIYCIKTENPHFYIDYNEANLCNIIMICVKDKIYNIMFDLDKTFNYYDSLRSIDINDLEWIKLKNK